MECVDGDCGEGGGGGGGSSLVDSAYTCLDVPRGTGMALKPGKVHFCQFKCERSYSARHVSDSGGTRHVSGPLSDQRIPGPSECKKVECGRLGAESLVNRLIIHRLRERESNSALKKG